MAILFTLVARGTVVLSEFSSASTNSSSIAKQILDKLPANNNDESRLSYSQDRFVFHVKRSDSLTVLCVADETTGRSIAFAFLEEIYERFVKSYGRAIQSARAYAMNDEFSRVLTQQIEYYSNHPNPDKMSRINSELSQVRNVTIENIDKVLRLEFLVDKTTNNNALRFAKQARRFRRIMWWRNFKFTIALILILSVVVYIAMTFVCNGKILLSCSSKYNLEK